MSLLPAVVAQRRAQFGAVSRELNQIFFDFPFAVPEYFALITRALIVLEGIALTGDKDFDLFDAAYPHAAKHAASLFGVSQLATMLGEARIAAAEVGERHAKIAECEAIKARERTEDLRANDAKHLADSFARQKEELTQQIAQAVQDACEPLGVGVVVECSHMCMCMRGVRAAGSSTVTSAVLGSFRSDFRTRQEFFANISMGARTL